MRCTRACIWLGVHTNHQLDFEIGEGKLESCLPAQDRTGSGAVSPGQERIYLGTFRQYGKNVNVMVSHQNACTTQHSMNVWRWHAEVYSAFLIVPTAWTDEACARMERIRMSQLSAQTLLNTQAPQLLKFAIVFRNHDVIDIIWGIAALVH